MNRTQQLLFSTWAVAVIGTAGSLFFSEVLKWPPCNLCWYQRLMLYPLTIILAIATVRKVPPLNLFAGVMAMVGAGISLYHYVIQQIPSMAFGSCGSISCTEDYLNLLGGWVTIPLLALLAFCFITVINLHVFNQYRKEKRNAENDQKP